ncbi:MAG: sigma-70 family RNA polymerase sigma factor [Clostridiales bacterium]|nr:sigma-70 family RNA polymerase sigma factor [Clostridiales bacterium]
MICGRKVIEREQIFVLAFVVKNMLNFAEEYMTDANSYDEEIDEQRIMSAAVSSVLELILKNELTTKQNLCLRMFYVHGKTQTQIARELKISQPTVSRHISTGRDILNKFLGYCVFAVKKANNEWLKSL